MNLQSKINNSKIQNPNSKIIKVLLVDDSPVVLKILKDMLSSFPDIHVAGTARNGREALEFIPGLGPTVVCTDLHMPVMDGLELTKAIMARYPRPILVISVSVEKGSANVFKLLEAGAIEVVTKPRSDLNSGLQTVTPEIVSKIRILAGVHVIRKPHVKTSVAIPPEKAHPSVAEKQMPARIVAIGASTGGPQALQTILSQLPPDFPLPVICVQHISDGFLEGLVDWLASQCKLKVRIAHTGIFPAPGTVYFPQEGTHLKFGKGGNFVSAGEPLFDGHRPSVSVTLQSVADHYGSAAIGILLTGMGRDGVEGMQAISAEGGITVAQDEESCVVFGMPKAAIDLGVVKYVLSLPDIVEMLLQLQHAR